ncbi:MAG: hypothetical protein ACOYIF_05905, partial [Acetivibrionales bacterium]
MKKSLITILIPTVIITVITFVAGGSGLVLRGVSTSINTAVKTALMLFVSFVLIGQLQVLITKDALERWLQKLSG